MKTYYEDMQIYEDNLRIAEADYEYGMIQAYAEYLNISFEECQAFFDDMEIMIDEPSLDEVEQMYVDYCAEYDIPCLQIPDYACYDRVGW